MNSSRKLLAIKAFHTVVWAFFAGCIVAIPVAVWHDQFHLAAVLAVIVLIEVAIIAFNRGRCPLTSMAAKHTSDRSDNFDIFLPAWLAKHNKAIFGSLYGGGLMYGLVAWAGTRGIA